ncbi:MAG TPA: DNA-protecting protein DprA, partial [Stenotrophomonas sp.]|nr:DNA-protecting protein DprA [Stenotrophomonas sp.]
MPGMPTPADDDRRRAEVDALLALALAGGPARASRDLLDRFGNAADALAAGPTAWAATGLGPRQAKTLAASAPERGEQARHWLEHPRHHLIGWQDADYPPLLRSSPNPPLALFVDGDPACLWQPAIAIVGSRNPSAGGRDNAYDLARALSSTGLCIGSGLAAGIDAAGQRAARDG